MEFKIDSGKVGHFEDNHMIDEDNQQLVTKRAEVIHKVKKINTHNVK
jgi:hypothetical protein